MCAGGSAGLVVIGVTARFTQMVDTFPRQYARTQRLTLGEPRNVAVSPDGERVIFLRSGSGDDPVNCLWVQDVASGTERLVADPRQLLASVDDLDLPPEERARRERMREGAGGITAFATNEAANVAAFALGGRLFGAALISGVAREIRVEGPVVDPRPDPTAKRIAYVSGPKLRIAELDGSSWELAGEDDPLVSWGSAEFIAAEEMGRHRGYWWNPTGSAIAAARVDSSPVQEWFIADAADPSSRPLPVRYPSAGAPNASVTLHVLALDGGSVDVVWDRERLPYLADVSWIDDGRLLVTVQSRDQKTLEVLEADALTGDTAVLASETDPSWVDLVPGSPAVLDDGRLVLAADRDGRRAILVDGVEVTAADLQVRSIAHVSDAITFTGNPLDDATALLVYRWDGSEVVRIGEPHGMSSVSTGNPSALRHVSLDGPGATVGIPGGVALTSFAERPLVEPNVAIHHLAERRLATAVLLPRDHDGSKLPVLLDPYGGPHAQRVVQSYAAYLSSQWFADQGFAVVEVDGRGTPGRGSAFERAVHLDLATAVLEDQVDALHAAAELHPELDLDRVAIRGWSFGGYLAALAVLRRPGDGLAAVRHALHGALPRRPERRREALRRHEPAAPRGRAVAPPAADPRPRRRQRGRRALAAAVVGAACRRQAARGAAARRRHAHDPAGGGRREPPAAPAGVHPPVARRPLTRADRRSLRCRP